MALLATTGVSKTYLTPWTMVGPVEMVVVEDSTPLAVEGALVSPIPANSALASSCRHPRRNSHSLNSSQSLHFNPFMPN